VRASCAQVIRELSRNKWMDPKEAVEYGMIDKVLTSPMPKTPGSGLPKFRFGRDGEAAAPGSSVMGSQDVV
jgi:ATP-dependent Clp protease protease subunit